jgi:hypothetical protein
MNTAAAIYHDLGLRASDGVVGRTAGTTRFTPSGGGVVEAVRVQETLDGALVRRGPTTRDNAVTDDICKTTPAMAIAHERPSVLSRMESTLRFMSSVSESEPLPREAGHAATMSDLAAVKRSKLLREHVALESMLVHLEEKILDARKRIYFPEYMHNVAQRRTAISRAHLVALKKTKDNNDAEGVRESLHARRRSKSKGQSAPKFWVETKRDHQQPQHRPSQASSKTVDTEDDGEDGVAAADSSEVRVAKAMPLTGVLYHEGVFFGIKDLWLEAFKGEFELTLQRSLS